ncbi:hypothetical protein GIW05_03005 [Pseudomonas syringae]|uniref:hypothetical protein n=1 Tax=Pseudomonas syringae TaxID=317 RepID=UPI001F3C3897|nr:hypothetical protein [Pseudomonas syringae]MCF5382474.1 hypothetical protein [Pseudomonas syringae]MCF5419361.1 hypothetical protein [Pseudomonas syringae]MCF5455041.1 hypothetical protein [Pseudomonas syringae]MCF5460483.1 hypothetical protein [Pseudomonas syringae]
MQQTIQLPLSDCKVAFARNLKGFYVNDGCAVFNAPRPLLGADHSCQEWCHGRFYAEVNLSGPYAVGFIEKNNQLDARLIFSVSDEELVEMLLVENRYADKYRSLAFPKRLEMLLPKVSKIQKLTYGEALALLDTARAMLAADSETAKDNQ